VFRLFIRCVGVAVTGWEVSSCHRIDLWAVECSGCTFYVCCYSKDSLHNTYIFYGQNTVGAKTEVVVTAALLINSFGAGIVTIIIRRRGVVWVDAFQLDALRDGMHNRRA